MVGSLSGLPYALAEAEQNFLIPSREEALIRGDLVPQMITEMVPVYAGTFTEEELAALVAFYDTPMGRSIG